MTNPLIHVMRIAVAAWLLGAVSPALPATVVIKLGTVAPEGSAWHEVLESMGQEWKRRSEGKVVLKIYAGGTVGDEFEMLRKTRRGGLQAVALSGVGLAHVTPSAACLQVPMLIESYDELDYVRARIAPRLEKDLLSKRYVVLQWGDVGWVHFFTRKPARTLDDIRQMKLWTSGNDPEAEKLYKEFGMKPVATDPTEIVQSLKTGLIDAFQVPPLFALVNQSFAVANNMIDVKWAPLIGGTVVRRDVWERIPAEMRPRLIEAAREAGLRLRDDIRRLGDEAIVEMEKRNLNVIRLDAATKDKWRQEAEATYPKIRGRIVPEDVFDEVVRLRNEFRNRR